MENSYMELFKQFCAARGIDKISGSFEVFEREFSGWLKEQKETGNEYLSIIKKFNLFSGNNKCAEVNKGVEDSITLPFHTKLITPYIDDTFINESDRIIGGNLYVNKTHIVPVITSDAVNMMVITREQTRTYMTQNPYSFDMINGYSLLCHYTSRDSKRTELSKKYLLELSKIKPIYAIPEEDTIYINNGIINFIGTRPYYEFKNGKIYEKNPSDTISN